MYPGLVSSLSCPFYAIPIYPFKFINFFIYLYRRATQTGGGCIGSRRAVLAFVLARAGRAMLALR